MKQREGSIHLGVAGYLRSHYPGVIFRTDFAAGIKMTMGQAVKHKHLQGDRAYPDLFIAEPINGYHGLFIELKREDARIWLKNGQLSTDKHVQEQAAILGRLDKLGYCARFAIGFDEAIDLIKWYLGGARSNEKLINKSPNKNDDNF